LKIFKCLRNIFQQSNKKLEESNVAENSLNIPRDISNEENIARFIFSPINVNPKNNNLKINCLKPPMGYDEISVNRFDYTDKDFLKNIALDMQAPKKEFYGLAIVKAQSIRENKFDVVYTPIKESNPFHADIRIGYIVEKDVELPAEISAQIREILKSTLLFKDPDTSKRNWVGDEIKCS
jgi:polynucleotide 5'-kinase involved in rRNA processing